MAHRNRDMLPHQLRQLGDIRSDPSRLILTEQLSCRSPAGLLLINCHNPALYRPALERTSCLPVPRPYAHGWF